MNRKQKIIVSVVAILIVTLALVGITYAYFLTQIQGNTNTKSIEVSTANLVVDYGEDTNVIQTKTGLTPGNIAVTKTFSATNHGSDEAGYVAILRDVVYKNTKDNSTLTGFERQQDLTYTLTCKQFNESNVETGTCNGITNDIFPTATNVSIMVSNKVPVGYTHKYTLTINYLEAGVDQSHDMAKSFSAKVDIEDIKRLNNPYDTGVSPENNKSLAYNIIQNATINKNGTSLVSSPLTKPAEDDSLTKYKTEGSVATNTTNMTITTTYQNYYWTYGTGYTIDEITGKFTLTGVKTCKYNDPDTTKACPAVLVDKYIVSYWYSSNSNSDNIAKTTTNLSSVYKVVTAPVSTTATITSTVKEVTSIPYSTEKELSVTQDDYGTSYYFRGGVEDNYVNFAGMCWRIVRIEGDGSTKLILEDSAHECNSSEYTGNWTIGDKIAFGYDDNYRADFLNYTGGLADALKTYQGTLSTKISSAYTGKTITDYLKTDEWCYDNLVTSTHSWGYDDEGNIVYTESESTEGWYTDDCYGTYTRIYTDKNPSLKCSGTKYTSFKDNTPMYVGTLTADEIAYAGESHYYNKTYFLINNYELKNYLYWWTLSPSHFDDDLREDYAFGMFNYSYLSTNKVRYDGNLAARPAITLSSSVEILTGDGTKNNPYTLK